METMIINNENANIVDEFKNRHHDDLTIALSIAKSYHLNVDVTYNVHNKKWYLAIEGRGYDVREYVLDTITICKRHRKQAIKNLYALNLQIKSKDLT